MAKRSKPNRARIARKKKQFDPSVFSHPGTTAMLARIAGCNKPPIIWLKQADGSWLECFLKPDCTYGNCHAVDESVVPQGVRGGK